MYSVTLPVGDAASQVARHDGSFCRHDVVTHSAICRHAGSLGQLVAPEQQFVSAHVAQDDAAALKICITPGQLPASVPTPASSSGGPASLGGDAPPPGVPPGQGAPPVDLHAPIDGGRGLDDEHAKSVAIAPARAGGPSRRSAARAVAAVAKGGAVAQAAAEAVAFKDESFEAMAIVFLGPWWRGVSSVLAVDVGARGGWGSHGGACWRVAEAGQGGRSGRTDAHTSRAIEAHAACLPLRAPRPIGSN